MKRTLLFVPAIFAMTVQAQRLTVVVDPARGGTEYGARIDSHTYEKEVTLGLANRLRSLLAARGFDVVLTREADTVVTNDQRAAVANQARPLACLLLHSTNSGTGVHLFTSSLAPTSATSTAILWDEAQALFVQRSQRLGTELEAAFSRSKLTVSMGKTWIRPLDNMECPALAIEVAPESARTGVADQDYQTRIVDAIANSLLVWRNQTDVVQSIVGPPHTTPPPATLQQDAAKAVAAATGTTTGKAVTPETAPKGTTAQGTGTDPVSRPPIRKVPATPAKPEEGSTPQ